MKGFSYFIMSILYFMHGCTDPASRVDINNKFLGNPPYQQTPKVTNIAANDYRVEIKMDPQEIGSPYYAFKIGASKMVLRDDGKSGDIEKRDGVYTLIYNDQGKFLKELDATMRTFHKALNNNQQLYRIISGHTIPVNTQEILDFEKSLRFTKSLKGIHIPLDLVQFPFLSEEGITNTMSIKPTEPLFIIDHRGTKDSAREINISTVLGRTYGSIQYFNEKIKP